MCACACVQVGGAAPEARLQSTPSLLQTPDCSGCDRLRHKGKVRLIDRLVTNGVSKGTPETPASLGVLMDH